MKELKSTQLVINEAKRLARKEMYDRFGVAHGAGNYLARIMKTDAATVSQYSLGKRDLINADQIYRLSKFMKQDMTKLYRKLRNTK